MKIPNYDWSSEINAKKRLNGFLNEEYRMLICGQSNCGKTNTVIHMLRKPLVYYDKIYMYTPNAHQNKLDDLRKLMNYISSRVGYDVMEVKSQDEIMDTSEYPVGNRKLVIFDDLVNAPKDIQGKIANHFTDGRHHGISPIYVSQSYYDTPSKIRLNCSHMILYPPVTKNHSNLIGKENMIDPELFNELGPYEFLFLDKECRIIKKNFDEDF